MSDPASQHETVTFPAGPPDEAVTRNPFAVALGGWLLPGLGYFLMGERARGLIAGITILLLYLGGIFVGGIRVIDVPGYRDSYSVRPDDTGSTRRVLLPDGRWTLTARPIPTLLEKPWYLGQFMAGPVNLFASYASISAGQRQIPKSTAHMAEYGTLYCAVAGLLNLLIIIDATSRAMTPDPREHD